MNAEHHDLLKKQDRYIQELMLLNQIDEEMNSQFSMRHVLEIAMDASLRLSGAEAGYIALLQSDGKLHIQKYIGHAYNLPNDKVVNERWVYQTLNHDLNLMINVQEAPDIHPAFPNTKSLLIFTLQSHDRPIGILQLETSYENNFTEETFEFIKRLSKRLAIALSHMQLYKELEERYEELEQLYRQISKLEQIKTDMIRIAAHDIRTPTSSIINYVRILQRDLQRDNTQEILRLIEEAIQNVEAITQNILSLEQIENLQTQVLIPIDIRENTIQAYNRFIQQAELCQINLELNVPETPIFVAGLELLIQEAITNFISNAIKYTPEGGNVQINLYIENGNAVLSIIDNGYGIPEEQQPALFQPFYRPQNSITQKISGTGLGLYLIKQIVERFNGEVYFSSKFGEGSTFGLKLPIYFG
jgi:signal transduction histidine kinase